MVKIITDSTADLSETLIERYRITVVPLSVYLDGETYKDGVDIDDQKIFELVSRGGEFPKTAAPSIAEFFQVFQGPQECFYVGISSQLSSTVANAVLAAERAGRERVRVLDSLNLSTGIGLLALKAAELAAQGRSVDEIAAAVSALVPKVRTTFIIETLEYLYLGGRCTSMENVIGSLLKIRPVVEVKPDGSLGIKSKLRGTRKKALDSLLEDFAANLESVDLQRVFITHTGCERDAEYLKEEIRRISSPGEICITLAGSVIASHCGPDTIGVLYLVK